jgi:hypothetical protein
MCRITAQRKVALTFEKDDLLGLDIDKGCSGCFLLRRGPEERKDKFGKHPRDVSTRRTRRLVAFLCLASLAYALLFLLSIKFILCPSIFATPFSEARLPDFCPWCPSDDPLCARKFVFIVATGRSGSTTIMGMLNGIPGVFVSGENDNEPSRLREIFAARMQRVASNNSLSLNYWSRERMSVQGWIWETNMPEVRRRRRQHPVTIVGFKEIRWNAQDVGFIQHVCPCSRFVVSTRRDATRQARSGFYERSENPEHAVREANRRIETAAATIHPASRMFRIRLEDFSVDEFNALAAWLGFGCKFDRLIHSNARSSYVADGVARCLAMSR